MNGKKYRTACKRGAGAGARLALLPPSKPSARHDTVWGAVDTHTHTCVAVYYHLSLLPVPPMLQLQHPTLNAAAAAAPAAHRLAPQEFLAVYPALQ